MRNIAFVMDLWSPEYNPNWTRNVTSWQLISPDSNSSSVLENSPKFNSSTLVTASVLLFIGILSFLGNAVTLVSILRSGRQKQSSVYYLIGQLAATDLLVSVFCVLTESVWTFTIQWLAGDFACKGIKFLQTLALHSSTFVLVVIGFDRFSAVRWPLERENAKKTVRKMLITVWILSVCFSLPQVYIFRVVRGPFVDEFLQCVTFGAYSAPWQERLYTGCSLVLLYILPLTLLLITYFCIFRTIAKSSRGFPSSTKASLQSRRRLLNRAKRKSILISLVIVVSFMVCWTPYYITMIVCIFLDTDPLLSEIFHPTTFFFGASSALVNSLVYGAFHLRSGKVRDRRDTALKMESCITVSLLHSHQRSRLNIK